MVNKVCTDCPWNHGAEIYVRDCQYPDCLREPNSAPASALTLAGADSPAVAVNGGGASSDCALCAAEGRPCVKHDGFSL